MLLVKGGISKKTRQNKTRWPSFGTEYGCYFVNFSLHPTIWRDLSFSYYHPCLPSRWITTIQSKNVHSTWLAVAVHVLIVLKATGFYGISRPQHFNLRKPLPLSPRQTVIVLLVPGTGLNSFNISIMSKTNLSPSSKLRWTMPICNNLLCQSSINLQHLVYTLEVNCVIYLYFCYLVLTFKVTQVHIKSSTHACFVVKPPSGVRGQMNVKNAESNASCMNMPDSFYNLICNSCITWICCSCGMPNFTPSALFASCFSILMSNSFIGLSDLQINEGDSPLSCLVISEEPTLPLATSSPEDSSTSEKQKGKGTGHPRQESEEKTKLRTLPVNCDRIQNKFHNLQVLVETYDPHIIIRTESNLTNQFWALTSLLLASILFIKSVTSTVVEFPKWWRIT